MCWCGQAVCSVITCSAQRISVAGGTAPICLPVLSLLSGSHDGSGICTAGERSKGIWAGEGNRGSRRELFAHPAQGAMQDA